jgi:hypothetical protein
MSNFRFIAYKQKYSCPIMFFYRYEVVENCFRLRGRFKRRCSVHYRL